MSTYKNLEDEYLYSTARMADPTTVSTFSPCVILYIFSLILLISLSGPYKASLALLRAWRDSHGAWILHLSRTFYPICPGADHLHMAAQLSACEPTRGWCARVRRVEMSRRRR